MAPSHKDKPPTHTNLAIIAEDFPGGGSIANANEHFPWNSPHFYALLRRLIGSVPEYRDENYWGLLSELEKAATRVVYFSRVMKLFNDKLCGFFKGPATLSRLMPDESSTSTPTPSNELLVASFIGFLLETIKELSECNNVDLIVPVKKEIDILEKQLKFLFIFLENTPLQCNEIDGLLSEINDAANQAGTFLYSFFFTMDGAKKARIDVGLDDLLKKIEPLNAKIKRHCLALVSKLPSTCASPSSPPAVVSPFVFHFLVEDLEDLLLRKADLIHAGLKDQIATVCEGLKSLRSFLRDVEADGQQGEHGELEKLATKIKEVAFDAGYIISLFVIGGASTWSFTVELSNAITNAKNRIKLMMTELAEFKKSYEIGIKRVADHPSEKVPPLTKRHPLVDVDIVGFQGEAEKFLEQLVGGPQHLHIISIVGMPGLGKTTLAKKLYNDNFVVYHFDRRAWCVISQKYKRRSLLIDILSSVSDLESEKILKMEDESLAEELYKSLKGRRYFIVMDDVWGIDAWDDLRRCFPDDGNGSRILFTSRRKDVALQALANNSIHALPFLSEDQCWELLKKRVFQKQQCPPELVDIGMKIAAGCQGLPLSVVVIASVLAKMEKKASLWNEVAGNMTSHISEDPSQCLNILELSYKHLPEHLKLCFLYFGAFPEDTEIQVRKLISHWIAEGFIHKEEEKSLEDLGQEYLAELIDRSLIIVAKRKFDGGVKACSIHDLLHDLCLRMVEKEKFLDLMGQEFSVSSSLNSTSRCLVFGLRVRSLLGFSFHNSSVTFASLKLLRVLQQSEQTDVHGIGLLIHLRYLDVEYLPTAIGCLVNLEVLVVRRGGRISEALLKMPKLQYVYFQSPIEFVYSLYNLTTKDKSFENNKIQSISFLRIKHGRDDRILKNFPHLRRLKCSFIASKDSSQKRCFYPVIDFLTQLESLNVSLEGQVNWFSDVLSFPLNLKKLALSGFKLSGDEVSMIGGLPKLEVLKLLKVSMEGNQWNARDDEFQQLRFLKLDNVQIAEWNACSEHFPQLEQLVLRNCTLLEEIPSSLGDITTLHTIQVELCRKSVAESAMRIREEQQDMGNEELMIIISR